MSNIVLMKQKQSDDTYKEYYPKTVAEAVDGLSYTKTASGTTIKVNDVSVVNHTVKTSISSLGAIDLSTVEVGVYGKNLIPKNIFDENLWTESTGAQYHSPSWSLPAGTYTLTADNNVTNGNYGFFYLQKSSDNFATVTTYRLAQASALYEKVTFTVENNEKIEFFWYGGNKKTPFHMHYNVQIEEGSEKVQEYEEPQGAIYISNSDGSVEGVSAISPHMYLFTNTADVNIDIEYLTDTITSYKEATTTTPGLLSIEDKAKLDTLTPYNVDKLDYVTPYEYGAVGDWDGTTRPKSGDKFTDDSTAFQDALDSGKTVYVPTGKYKIDKTLTITKDHTHLIIDGDVATSAGVGILIQASDVHVEGNGTFWFYGSNDPEKRPLVCGSAIRVESTGEEDDINYAMRIKIDVRLETNSGVIYNDFTNSAYSGDEYDSIAIQVASTYKTPTTTGNGRYGATYPLIINSTISSFRTAISIRKKDLHGTVDDDVYDENWCTGFEFHGTIENCLVAIDNERAGGGYIGGSVQPRFPDNVKTTGANLVHTYNKPLVKITSNTIFDCMLWDLGDAINKYALKITGTHNSILRSLHNRFVDCPGYLVSSNNFITSKHSSSYYISAQFNKLNPYPTSIFQYGNYYQYDNILENALYNDKINISTSWSYLNTNEEPDNNMSHSIPITALSVEQLKKVFSTGFDGQGIYRYTPKSVVSTVTIEFDEPINFRGIEVVGMARLSDEVKFVLHKYTTNSDTGETSEETKEYSRYLKYTDDNGNTVGDYGNNNGGLGYATLQWTYNDMYGDSFWGEGSSIYVNEIKKIDIQFIAYEYDPVKDPNYDKYILTDSATGFPLISDESSVNYGKNASVLVAAIDQISIVAGETNYLTKNGGEVQGKLLVPTPTEDGQVVNKKYVDSIAPTIQPSVQTTEFVTVSDGNWDFSVSDKIILEATDLISITNIQSGAAGIIRSTIDITLPENSKKSMDYDYITGLGDNRYWLYTFIYDGTNYNWNRTVCV